MEYINLGGKIALPDSAIPQRYYQEKRLTLFGLQRIMIRLSNEGSPWLLVGLIAEKGSHLAQELSAE